MPADPTLGTVSALGIGSGVTKGEEMDKFREKCHKEYERRVNNGTIDVLSEMQSLIALKRGNTMIGYELEMWFGHPTNDWYRGKVISIVNGKADRVKVAWNREGLHAENPTETVQCLKDNKQNQKRQRREHEDNILIYVT